MKKKGVYCFADVGRSDGLSVRPYTKWFPDDNLRTPWPRIMKFHREVGHDLQMTPIDLGSVGLRSQGSGEVKRFPDDNLRTLWPMF